MKLQTLGDINLTGASSVIANDAIAVAIGPGSLTDQVLINGSLRLAPCQLLPVAGLRTVEPIRATWSGSGVIRDSIAWGELLIFEPGDCLFTPGPRAPYLLRYDGVSPTAALAIRLPFQGRRNSRWFIAADAAITWTLYGVRYFPRASGLTVQSARIQIDTAALAGAANYQSYTQFYFGGRDAEENWDELHLATVGAADIIVEAEAWGEFDAP